MGVFEKERRGLGAVDDDADLLLRRADIVMMHGSEYSDRGWFINLDEMLEEPNLFVEEGTRGSERWKDMFPDYMWTSDMTSDAAGNIVAVPVMCYPGTATAYFYNKEIFAELNLKFRARGSSSKASAKPFRTRDVSRLAPWSLNAKANIDVWDVQFSLGPTYAERSRNNGTTTATAT